MKLEFDKNNTLQLVPTTKNEKYVFNNAFISNEHHGELTSYAYELLLAQASLTSLCNRTSKKIYPSYIIFNNPFNYIIDIKDHKEQDKEIYRLNKYCELYKIKLDADDIFNLPFKNSSLEASSFTIMHLAYAWIYLYIDKNIKKYNTIRLAKKLARIKKLYKKSIKINEV